MNPRQEAENKVEMFYLLIMQVVYSNVGQQRVAIQCAIKHVEGILESINKLNDEIHFNMWAKAVIGQQYMYYQLILHELKQM